MRAVLRTPIIGAVGGMLVVAPLGASVPAYGTPNPGQPVENDYGQTEAEVSTEVASTVAADPAVHAARAKVAAAHALTVARSSAELRAKKSYAKARKTHKKKAIARARRAYAVARSRTTAARAAEASAVAAAATVVASVTSDVRWAHYRPVDGSFTGARSTYYVGEERAFHPIVVSITVTAGHVSAVSVPVYETTGDSGSINAAALPVLIQRALAANDTAEVASVSGASLTSSAFRNSLSSALLAAGYHA